MAVPQSFQADKTVRTEWQSRLVTSWTIASDDELRLSFEIPKRICLQRCCYSTYDESGGLTSRRLIKNRSKLLESDSNLTRPVELRLISIHTLGKHFEEPLVGRRSGMKSNPSKRLASHENVFLNWSFGWMWKRLGWNSKQKPNDLQTNSVRLFGKTNQCRLHRFISEFYTKRARRQ